MSCANFQELLAGSGTSPNTTTAVDFTPANIDFPYDSDDELRLDIYNYEDQQWVNVPLATGATIDVGGAGDVFYAWETYQTNGQTGVRTILATAGTTPALPAGGTASHPLAPANNNYPVQGGTGINVRLYRQTSIEAGEMPAYFYPGASIRAQDLNDNFEALRKVVEENSCSTDNVTNAIPQLDARYWNKVDTDDGGDVYTSASTGAWPNNDTTIATTAAGDDRWLGIPGEGGTTITAGDGIALDGAEISVDLADTNPGLQFTGGDLQAIGNSVTQDGDDVRLTNGPSNVTITGAGGINVTRTSATELTITDAADNNTTYDFGNTAVSGNARLRLTGSDGTTDDVLINAGNNVTFTNQSATGFTINATGGGSSGGNATVVANVNALNTAADSANDGDLFLLLDSTGLNAAAASGDNDEDVNGLPMTEAAGAPVGGYGGEIQVTMSWDNGNTRWQFIRWAVQEPDNRYVLESGDTMTGNLLFNDGTNDTIFINDDGSARFNAANGDADFRIDGDTEDNVFFVDASTNRVGMGSANPNARLQVTGPNQNSRGQLTIAGSNAGAGDDARLTLYRANDFIGSVVGLTDHINITTEEGHHIELSPEGTEQLRASDTGVTINEGGADVDFRVEGNTEQNMLFVNGGTNRVGIATDAPNAQLGVNGSFIVQNGANTVHNIRGDGTAVFNQQQDDADFRVASDNIQNMLFVDGGEDRVGINTGTPRTFLDVNGLVSIDQNAITAGAGNWNLNNGNFWTLGAVVVPNPTNMVAGMSGLIVNTAAATWPAAGGATFQYAANTPPNITEFPAVIPFYCTNNTTIFIGTPTVNIT